jgi:hypothetical protein
MQNGIDILVGVQAHQPGGPVSQLIERPVDPISVGRPRTAQNRRTVDVRNREGSVARAAVDDDEPIDEIANTFPTPPRMLFFVVRENEHRKNLVGHVASSHRVLAPHRGQRRIPLTPVRNYPLMPESAPETSPYPPLAISHSFTRARTDPAQGRWTPDSLRYYGIPYPSEKERENPRGRLRLRRFEGQQSSSEGRRGLYSKFVPWGSDRHSPLSAANIRLLFSCGKKALTSSQHPSGSSKQRNRGSVPKARQKTVVPEWRRPRIQILRTSG